MSIKLRIRIGEAEIDYEGTEEFLRQELTSLINTAMELHNAVGASASNKHTSTPAGKGTIPSLTTSTIAARLKAKTGPDLVIAAAAHLTLVSNRETFSRQELLTEMQSASSYYKKTYSNNLTKYLKGTVTDGRLQETSKNSYALSAGARSALGTQLVDA